VRYIALAGKGIHFQAVVGSDVDLLRVL